jgi:hypothetical protein
MLPLVAMLGSLIRMARRIARALAGRDGKPVGRIIDEHRNELKRSNDMLERFVSSRQQGPASKR